jgi:hypothetical protein
MIRSPNFWLRQHRGKVVVKTMLVLVSHWGVPYSAPEGDYSKQQQNPEDYHDHREDRLAGAAFFLTDNPERFLEEVIF